MALGSMKFAERAVQVEELKNWMGPFVWVLRKVSVLPIAVTYSQSNELVVQTLVPLDII